MRPYDRARSRPAALALLREAAGTRLDPLLVESFCRLFDPSSAAPGLPNTAVTG